MVGFLGGTALLLRAVSICALVGLRVKRRRREPGRVRRTVIPDFRSTTLRLLLHENVILGATIYTDGLKNFTALDQGGFRQVGRIQPLQSDLCKGVPSAVLLADRAIGNLQQWLPVYRSRETPTCACFRTPTICSTEKRFFFIQNLHLLRSVSVED